MYAATGQAVQADPADQHRDGDRQRGRVRQPSERRVDRQPDHDHVAHRAEPGPLAQRDPREQHERADEDDDRPERQAGALRDALMEDVPRVEAQAGADLWSAMVAP